MGTPFNEFYKIDGRLDQIAVGYGVDSAAGNAVWGLAGSQPYRFNFTSNAFEPVSGRLTSISVRDWNGVWGLNGSDVVRWDPDQNTFFNVPGQRLTSISGLDVAGKSVWGLLSSGLIEDPAVVYRFDQSSQLFQEVPGQRLTIIAVGGGDPSQFGQLSVWGLNQNEIFRWDNDSNKFVQVVSAEHQGTPAQLESISVGYSEVWGLVNDIPYRFNFTSNVFEWVSGGLDQISALSPGWVWGLSLGGPSLANNQIFQFDSGSKSLKQIPGPKLASISVGTSSNTVGSVLYYETWGLDANGNIFRYVTPDQ